MTQNEIEQMLNDLNNRVRYLEMSNSPMPFPTDWQTPPTQACSQEELMKPSYHCTHEHP